jgi:hypothetical protein
MRRDAPSRVELLQGTLDLLILRARAMALILNPVDQEAQ